MVDYNDLIERCKEICDWQDTGLLKGDALRNFAASRPYAQQHNLASIAQAETLREAADAFLVMAARVAELEAARIAYASEFPPDAEGLPDTGRIHANICAMKIRVAELHSSLSEVVGDLEMRSHLKRGEDYGLVDVSNGVYMRAKHALGQMEGETE